MKIEGLCVFFHSVCGNALATFLIRDLYGFVEHIAPKGFQPVKRITPFLLALTIITLACGGTPPSEAPLQTAPTATPPASKGDRILSIDVNPAKDGDYEIAFQAAQRTGMGQTGIFLVWTALETAPGVYRNVSTL